MGVDLSPIEKAFRSAAPSGASLAEHLQAVATEARERRPEYMRLVDAFVARLEQVRAGSGAPAVGVPMPPFLLPDQDGRLIHLDELLTDGPAAIAILRGHWCPNCRLNMIGLSHVHRQSRASLVVISPEVQQYTRLLREHADADFPVLTDAGAGYILSLGLTVMLDPAIAKLIEAAGWDVPLFQGGTGWVLPIPSVFVVRQNGLIAARHIDPDYRRRMGVDELLAAITAARDIA